MLLRKVLDGSVFEEALERELSAAFFLLSGLKHHLLLARFLAHLQPEVSLLELPPFERVSRSERVQLEGWLCNYRWPGFVCGYLRPLEGLELAPQVGKERFLPGGCRQPLRIRGPRLGRLHQRPGLLLELHEVVRALSNYVGQGLLHILGGPQEPELAVLALLRLVVVKGGADSVVLIVFWLMLRHYFY